jgi:hypothetical protein
MHRHEKGLVAALLTTALMVALPAAAQDRFPTADAAVESLVQTVSTPKPDEARLAALFGKDWREVVPKGSVDQEDLNAFLSMYKKQHALQPGEQGRQVLAVGDAKWTFPVPLAKDAKGWYFDLPAGTAEIVARRIGRNELDVVESLLAYHDAQSEYATEDRDGDGVLEYAQKLVSTDGTHDGLFWADDDSGEISPLGPLFGDETPKSDWHGYRYRILTAQGASAPGGAFDYLLGKNMSRGFALIAWPADYGKTGVKSFMISHDGLVFEQDLGPQGDALARKMKSFDPDSAWTEVKP